MPFKTIDAALEGLCTIVISSPYKIKQIAFSSGNKVDASMICATNGEKRLIPGEQIIFAIDTLKKCYNALAEQIEHLFFMVYYGRTKEYLPQLVDGLSILADIEKWLAEEIIIGYCNSATPIEAIALKLNIEYKQAEYICGKARKRLKGIHSTIRYRVEGILVEAGYIIEI